MKILVFDNYDSFTYNIVYALYELGEKEVDVFRNDRIGMEDVEKYDKIILSPGPGIPSEAGMMNELIKCYAFRKSILGICLGEQAIGECFGARLENLERVYHGIATPVMPVVPDYLFEGLGDAFTVGRYHSWVVSDEAFPATLQVTARDREGRIMALTHREYDVKGVQFHPESILTPQGIKIFSNFLNHN